MKKRTPQLGRPVARIMMSWSMTACGTVAAMLITARAVSPLHAQGAPAPTGWEPAGLPALNYDSDEGFGYGVLLELYNYGDGGYSPYRFTLQPTVFLTTGGRREFTLFFDAPHLLPEGWRIDASLAGDRQFAIPYYGLGNTSVYDALLEDTEGQYFYRFGRTQRRAAVNVQRELSGTPIRVLAGVGATHTDVDPLPKDATATLLSQAIGGAGTRTTSGSASSGIRVIGKPARTVARGQRYSSRRCRNFWGASPDMFGGRWWIAVTCPLATGSRS